MKKLKKQQNKRMHKFGFISIVIGVAILTYAIITIATQRIYEKKVQTAPIITPATQQQILPKEVKPVKEVVESLDATESYMLTLVNNRRRDAGLAMVIELRHINYGAYNRAVDLGGKNQWSHDGFASALYGSLWNPQKAFIGENLAKNYDTEDKVIEAWMNSPKHKEILLNARYKYMGVGHYQTYWVLWMSNKP